MIGSLPFSTSFRTGLVGFLMTLAALFIALLPMPVTAEEGHAVARVWKQHMLDAISRDRAMPTVHARNLYHLSAGMWDAWAAYDPHASGVLHAEKLDAADPESARQQAISHAAYRIIRHRFEDSPGAGITLPLLDDQMDALGLDPGFEDTTGDSPAALGNRIAATIIAHGLVDGSNEADGYANQYYESQNPPLFPDLPGNPDMEFPNLWQPLAPEAFCDQIGNVCFPTGTIPEFLSPEWGVVQPFALSARDLTVYPGPEGFDFLVYHDPGPPPYFNGEGDEAFRTGFVEVVATSAMLDPDDGEMMDISPGALGNNSLGLNDGLGHHLNPHTGKPYDPQIVPRGDYMRVLAEFWADGPDSETPPGHWYSIFHYVTDHPEFERHLQGNGPELDELEWYVKGYLALGGALHDAAIAAWGAKGYYDYVRPISAIRFMAEQGQSSDPEGPSYHPDGIPLVPDLIEVITEGSSAPGERHEHLAEFIGEIALYAWYGFPFEEDAGASIQSDRTGHLGVHWIRAGEWWPYQRPTFITPPFAGYVSGHSTFSRTAAEVLTRLTGDPFFPGGIGEFEVTAHEFLEFESGPSQDLVLQWATYQDAADQCSLSRIYGGIHPPQDDIPGRLMGYAIGHNAFDLALKYFKGDSLFRDRFAGQP